MASVLQMSVQPQAKVPLQEATLGSLQQDMRSGTFTCSDIVDGYVQARMVEWSWKHASAPELCCAVLGSACNTILLWAQSMLAS